MHVSVCIAFGIPNLINFLLVLVGEVGRCLNEDFLSITWALLTRDYARRFEHRICEHAVRAPRGSVHLLW